MANSKISQLPAASALTGAELVELSQGAPLASVQSTAQAIANLNPPAFIQSILGSPNVALGSGLNAQLGWATVTPGITGGGTLNGATFTNNAPGWQYNSGNAATTQNINGAGTNLENSVQLGIFPTGNVSGNTADHSATYFNAISPSSCALIRLASNGLPIAGFTMTLYFSLHATQAAQRLFFGFAPGTGSLASGDPSALLNIIGVGKDSGDTTLSFMINNGAGTATKTALTGATMAALQAHLLKLVITCDGAGNCVITLTDLETGGLGTFTNSYPTATAKLPASNTQVEPHFWIQTQAAQAISYGIMAGFITSGFGSI